MALNQSDLGSQCPECGHPGWKDGFTTTGRQRYKCSDCGKKYSTPQRLRPDEFGPYLRNLRESKNMTIQNVCELLGKTKGWLSRIENGQRGIDNVDLIALSSIYDMRPSEIWAGYERLFYPNVGDR